jgi:hypothetical protein
MWIGSTTIAKHFDKYMQNKTRKLEPSCYNVSLHHSMFIFLVSLSAFSIISDILYYSEQPVAAQATPGSNTNGITNFVSANVTEQQQPPEALDQNVETTMNTPVNITLQANDANLNDELTAEIVSPPSNGQLSEINQDTGTVNYTPNPGFTGQDSFTYKVNDGIADSINTATGSITVNGDGDGGGMVPSDSGGCAFGSAADPITGECIPQPGLTQCPPGMQLDEADMYTCRIILS